MPNTPNYNDMEDLGYTYDNSELGPSKPDKNRIHYPSVRVENVPNLEGASVDDMVEITFVAKVRGIDSHNYGERSNKKIHYDLELHKGMGKILDSKAAKEASKEDVSKMKKSKGSNYMDKLTATESD
jgi:hypothetical protein